MNLDEATPHVHIDFVPFATGQKRGLPTRNTLSKALEQQGFKGEGKLETNTKMWIEREKQELAAVMLTRGIEWEQLGTHNEHLSVLDYKKQERQKELKDLDSKTKSAEWVLNQREKLLSDIETTIDRLDGEYQEKRDTIESMDTEIAAKQSEVEQVNEELTAAADQLAEQQALIAESAGKASQIKDINSIETKKTVFGGKITVSADDYDKVSALAKKQIAAESHEKKLNEKISTLEQEKAQLTKEKEELQKKNDEQAKEISFLKSVRERLNVEKLKSEIEEWKKKYNRLMEFIESLNLKEQLEKFLHPVQNIIKHKSR